MANDKLLESVKKHEGFRNKVYLDSLGKRTIGYGHLCVEDKWVDGWTYSQVELEDQLGGSGVKKFRNMWSALREAPPNYVVASLEMLDSKWAKQTPNRAKEMSDHMKGCV